MATAVSYPGIYIEEIPSGIRTIAGVATSIAAFVGFTARGPANSPVRILSFADFERQFGGLDLTSDLSYAVSHFFLNGGTTAWIVRVAKGAAAAAINLENVFDGSGDIVLTASAASAGAWGNKLRIVINYDTSSPASLFNLSVSEIAEQNGRSQARRAEVHRNLSMDSFAPSYVVNVVNAASELIRLERPAGLAFTAPGLATSGVIEDTDLALLSDNARRLGIALDGERTYEFDFMNEGDHLVGANFAARMSNLAARIETAVRALEPGNIAFANFTCAETVNGAQGFLTATSGTPAATREHSSVLFSSASRRNAATILSLGVAFGGREQAGAAALRPAQSGTAWVRQVPAIDFTALDSPGSVDVDLLDPADNVLHNAVISLWTAAGDRPADLAGLRALLQKKFEGVARPEIAGAKVGLVDERLVFIPGGDSPSVRLRFNSGPTVGGAIDLSDNPEPNVAAYQLGIGPNLQAQSGAVPGAEGTIPTAVELAGSRAAKTGMFALEDVDLFNILMFPNQSEPALLAGAIVYAEERRAFVLLDLPARIDTLDEATSWLNANGDLRHRNAAAYFPRARFADPLQNNRVRSFANSGALAGLYARIDGTRGVWKAPAGIEAGLRGARGLDYILTDLENGVINPLGLNALRLFPSFGPIAWGARTLVGSDALASEWKYVPVRRLALFIEESLYRGTQWVVFEPNDEPLWAQIRLNVGAFMHNLFRQGAFQGTIPRDAYLVKCDSTTTTQDDINLGIVNIVVGFAPLKPAEFVIIKLQQLAGQAGAGA
ncbi:phage tail sheath C-terminal domain-containing protein [Bradyrhizobium sp. USDA 3458]|uniref:phage tail sheath family protein n=1 Tax=Bradyrhizobium sp. USDA 3458 TaxID=2591461 RepID=UPI001143AF7B|nr:phage tail sheath C-terminal domain-containing protein [Bradyrhizobium sp. USDA 3458]